VVTYPIIFRAKYLGNQNKINERNRLANIIILRCAKLLFYVSGSKLIISGQENIPNDRPVLFVCNHQGHVDSLVLQAFIETPKGFITIKEYEKAPILRTWMRYMGCVFIDRKDTKQSLVCINEAINNLNNGYSMVVFPEGKLNDGGETLKFKKGWLRLATKSGVPIVPITLKNTYKVLSYNGRRVSPAIVECIVSKPIETHNFTRENKKEIIGKVRKVITQNL
jgi:1-acyl-sn-glycerol-3-phosphate acyltransferase